MPDVGRSSFKLALATLATLTLAGVLCVIGPTEKSRAAASCRDGIVAAEPSRRVAVAFERRYAAWHREAKRVQFSSNTRDYISLPSYRRIVALGLRAVPLLQTKLSEDHGADFMLADAVLAICGWNRRDFAGDSAQAFRDKVLRRLKGEN
jgi:hypothetical protein